MLKILKYLRKREWLFICVSLAFIVLQVFLDLKLPDYMTEITTLVKTEGSQISAVWTAGGWMLLCALGSGNSSRAGRGIWVVTNTAGGNTAPPVITCFA